MSLRDVCGPGLLDGGTDLWDVPSRESVVIAAPRLSFSLVDHVSLPV